MLLYKTKYPISVYFLLFTLTVQAVLLREFSIFKVCFYLLLTFCFLYVLFSRYACRIKVYDDSIKIKYFFFWDKDISIPLQGVHRVDYMKGFYDLTSDKSFAGLYSFPKYCYDKIVFQYERNEIEVLINTRIFMFDRAYSLIESKTLEKGK